MPEVDFERLGPLLVALGLLVLALAAFGAVFMALRRRWDSQEDEATPNDLLTQFRQARDSGEMTDEEFRKVKDLLSVRIRQQAGIASKPSTPRTQTPPNVMQNKKGSQPTQPVKLAPSDHSEPVEVPDDQPEA